MYSLLIGWAFAALMVIGLLPGSAFAQEDAAAASPITEAWARLESEELGLAERAAAAGELLEMRNNEATGALILALTSRQSRVGWRAVIQAVATFPEDPPRELAPPLIGLLGQVDKALVEDLAAALGRFDQTEVIKQLSRIARDSRAPISQRSGAVLTLGHDRTTQTAALLMEMTDPRQPEQVQQSAFVALGTLSALDHYDADRQAWASWWEKSKGLWAKEWTQHLLENFERREARRSARDHQIEEELLESQRALYRANSPKDRPSALVYMLRGDKLTPIRRLGMELTLQRLLDGLPFEEPLREALRDRLTDPAPDIRKDAAYRLRELVDVPAAELIAARLSEEREQVPSVLKEHLLMMTRLPQALAVDPAVDFLNDEALRADAAGSLAAAFDAEIMKRSQVNRAAKLLRKYQAGDQPPAPRVITLMGKVGNKDDWKRIADWADDPSDAVKKAAAQAWADSDRPLNHMADRVTDPDIQLILIAAATRRGTEPYTLRILTANRPKRDSSVEAWRGALVAMASRVPAQAVLDTQRQLSMHSGLSAIRLEVLSAALDRDPADSLTQADRLELLLTRGELLVHNGDPSAALADFLTVSASEDKLSESQLDRLGRGQISASLLVGQIEEAFAIARKILSPAPDGATGGRGGRGRGVSPTDDRIIDEFLKTADRLRAQGRKEAVATITHELRKLLNPSIKPEVGGQLRDLESWINGSATKPKESTDAESAPQAAEVSAGGNGPGVE